MLGRCLQLNSKNAIEIVQMVSALCSVIVKIEMTVDFKIGHELFLILCQNVRVLNVNTKQTVFAA